MKSSILLFVSVLFIYGSSIFAQRIEPGPGYTPGIFTISPNDTVDTSMLKCTFKMLSVNDVNKPDEITENQMLLQIGARISKFWDSKLYLCDSINRESAKQNMEVMDALNKSMPIRRGASTTTIFKNYPEGKITTIDRIPMSSYIYEEEIPEPHWNLSSDTLTVCGYSCQKATTTLFGRNYTAWYAPEIPISNGPWKFSGLPGLILRVEDDKKHYTFECISIEKMTHSEPIYIPISNSRFKTTKQRFLQAQKKYFENPSAAIANSNLVKSPLPASATKARPYNPIELSE